MQSLSNCKLPKPSDEEILVAKFLSGDGLRVLFAMQKLFCDTTRPKDEIDASYMQGRNSVILELYELLNRFEEENNE